MDPIAQLVTTLKTHAMSGKREVMVSSSRFRREIIKKLAELGFVELTREKKEHGRLYLVVELKRLTDIIRISKPSRRVYLKHRQIKPIRARRTTLLISTPEGVLTDAQARSRGVGGEVILEVS